MTTFANGESGSSVRTKINAAITTVDGLGAGDNLLLTAAERAKLTGIEALADVTDAANVANAGALMAASNLSDLASAGTARTNLGLGSGDNLLLSAAERTKLAGVEAGADVSPVASVGGQTGTVLVSALRGTVRSVTESTSVTATDNNGWIVCTGTLTVTVPTGLTAPFSVGILVVSGTVTIAGSGLTVNKRSDQALTIATAYAQAVLVSWASDTWAATGGLDASA
jgi:hypothetical protein